MCGSPSTAWRVGRPGRRRGRCFSSTAGVGGKVGTRRIPLDDPHDHDRLRAFASAYPRYLLMISALLCAVYGMRVTGGNREHSDYPRTHCAKDTQRRVHYSYILMVVT